MDGDKDAEELALQALESLNIIERASARRAPRLGIGGLGLVGHRDAPAAAGQPPHSRSGKRKGAPAC